MLEKLDDLKILTIAAIVAVALFATAAFANQPGASVCVSAAENSTPQRVAF